MRRGRISFAVTVLFFGMIVFLGGCSSSAVALDYEHYGSLQAIVSASDVVITGEVKNVKTKQEILVNKEKNIAYYYTVADVEVIEVLSGEAKQQDIIQVKQLEEEQTNIDAGYLKEGETDILFLVTYGNVVPASLTNPYQGRMPVVNNKVMVNPMNDIPEILSLRTDSKFEEVLKVDYKDVRELIQQAEKQ